jgi:hypothetical protein
MVTDRTLLVLLASVVIMLVGCKEPAGLPGNAVHAATTQTVYCYVEETESHSGYVSLWGGTPDSRFGFYLGPHQDHRRLPR